MPPLNYEIKVTGTGDGDPQVVKDAFDKVVKALRTAFGKDDVFSVSGALGGRVEAYRDAEDNLVPVEPLRRTDADVD